MVLLDAGTTTRAGVRGQADNCCAPERRVFPSCESVCRALSRRRTQTDQSFAQALPELLVERNLSVNTLAKDVGKSQSHFSRGLRGIDKKFFSIDIIRQVRERLGLPAGYFPEEREAFVVECLQNDPALRERLYKRLRAQHETD